MKPYLVVGLIWRTATDVVPIPMIGFHASPAAAQDDGFRSIAQAATTSYPDLLACPVTVTALPLDDATLKAFLEGVAQHRTALLQNMAIDMVRRGKKKSDATP